MRDHRLPPVAALAALAVLLLGASAASAQTPPAAAARPAPKEEATRVGVVVSLRVNVSVDEANLMAERLGDALGEKLIVDVIAGGEASRRLADLEVPEDCVAKPDCVARVAERLGADEMIFLVVVRVAGAFQIDPTWTDKFGAKVVAREAITLEEADKLPERVFRAAATRLLPHVPERQAQVTIHHNSGAPGGPGGPGPVDDGRRMTTGAWIAAGVGGAALVGGLVFGGLALGTNNSLEADGCAKMYLPSCAGDVDKLETQMLAADLLLGVAVVAAGTAAYLYLTSAPADTAPPVTVAPTSEGAGLMIHSVRRF